MAYFPTSIVKIVDWIVQIPTFEAIRAAFAEVDAITATLGVGVAGTSGTVAARLAAYDTSITSVLSLAQQGLVVTNNSTTPTTKVDVTADFLAIEGLPVTNVAVTLDLTATGKNGTAFARAADTWYFVWLGLNPTTGEVAGLFDNESLRANLDTSHASLLGFTKWRRIGALRANASQNLLRMVQHGADVFYYTDQTSAEFYVDAGEDDNAYYDRNLAPMVPPTSRVAKLIPVWVTAGVANNAIEFRVKGSSQTGGLIVSISDGSSRDANAVEFPLDSAQVFQSRFQLAHASNAARLYVQGYRDVI